MRLNAFNCVFLKLFNDILQGVLMSYQELVDTFLHIIHKKLKIFLK